MERIVYQKTLDVHKNGVQFTLQGFETADKLSRIIKISLSASGDAIDLPLEHLEAMMYVVSPGTDEPSINKCTIKGNSVIYDVTPITTEGITEMQLKLIEARPEGARSVLASPKFAIEVSKSNTDDESAEQSTTFTALEDAVAKAKAVYDARFLRMELSSDCMFQVYYADGTVYETDMLRELFHKGESILSQSYARGDTGVRNGEETDNAMYYSKVAESASIESKNMKEDAQSILDEVRLHGVYTAFSVNFETGDVEYISPRYSFKINTTTGDLEAEGESYDLEDEIGLIVNDWLIKKNVDINSLLKISGSHEKTIGTLKETSENHTEKISLLEDRVTPIEKGGTGATTAKEALVNLGVPNYQKTWNVDDNVGCISLNPANFSMSTTTQAGSEGSAQKDWYMINSGDIYISSTIYPFAEGQSQTQKAAFSYFCVEVKINGVVIYSYEFDKISSSLDGPINHHIYKKLSVKKVTLYR